ncbi:MAG: hypothetical protein KC466_17080 [Myxococcales bacterium]|nr:hypothetical protein [Myxococcales bacterium]
MLDLTVETRADAAPRLLWGDWDPRPPFRSWDRCLELRRAETPFGPYLLLRRQAPYRDDRTVLIGKWFVQRPAAAPLGPFDDDLQAARAAQADYAERAAALRAPDPELARLRAENARLRAENVRLGLALHHAIGSPKGVVPAGFEDLYEAGRTDD